MKHELKIVVNETGFGRTTLDGREIEDLVAIGFNSEVDSPTEVTLVMRNTSVELDATVDTERIFVAKRKGE